MERIGLIAGRGNFPLLFAQEAKAAGWGVTAIAVRGNTRGSLRRYVDSLSWIELTQFKDIARRFKEEGIHQVALAGQINPYSLFNPRLMNNPQVREFFGRIEDCRADTVFRAFAGGLEQAGLKLVSSTSFLDKYMPKEAVLSSRRPSPEEERDVNFGFAIAKHLGLKDIGQSVCLKNGIILAVEAIEGTDNTIRRAAALARSAIVLVKTAKPMQDTRFDVPVVGLKTIKCLPQGSCLAIEAGKTLFLDQKEAVSLAERKAITITAKNP